jgi:hypothetical protein
MANISDIRNTALSGLNHIDALQNSGPDWNYLTASNNTLYYTFKLDDSNRRQAEEVSAPTEFNASQKAAGRTAMAYLEKVTGIHFVETQDPSQAHMHLWAGDLVSETAAGEHLYSYTYRDQADGTLTHYDAQSWIYLDNARYAEDFAKMAPGTGYYQVMLHELGHALGLKHPFSGDTTLPAAEDNTLNTVMSYTSRGPVVAEFRPYDLAALNWLYGGDGLGGKLGLNSAGGQYLTGTVRDDVLIGGAAADMLEGLHGNNKLDGGAGLDVALYSDARSNHSIVEAGEGYKISATAGTFGTDELLNVERVAFNDVSVALDVNGIAGQAYRMYQAALGRTPDAGGLGYWIEMMDRGMTLRELAANFMATPEFAGKFGGGNPEDGVFVTKVYNNVLHRTPDEGGFKYFMDALAAGNSKIDMLAAFSESPENQAQLIGVIGNGIDYQPYV